MSGKGSLQRRAVALLTKFFANDDQRKRRDIFASAFGDCDPDPRGDINFEGGVNNFAAEAVDLLDRFGCAGRGQHHVSLLLATMATARGRQTDPEYAELQREFNQGCSLPSRDDELRHLKALLIDLTAKARIYAPLQGIAELQPENE